jgi:catechol 2,3-dioxygenase-like lactoylglutathione lyase family enzyme
MRKTWEEHEMAVSGMNHFTILTDDVERTVGFYDELMGLKAGYRPPLNFPGAWLYAGDQPILHVIGGRPKNELRPGVIDHMAFTGQDLNATLAMLERENIEHVCRQQPGSGVWQVFLHDPNGAKVELDFVTDDRPSSR